MACLHSCQCHPLSAIYSKNVAIGRWSNYPLTEGILKLVRRSPARGYEGEFGWRSSQLRLQVLRGRERLLFSLQEKYHAP